MSLPWWMMVAISVVPVVPAVGNGVSTFFMVQRRMWPPSDEYERVAIFISAAVWVFTVEVFLLGFEFKDWLAWSILGFIGAMRGFHFGFWAAAQLYRWRNVPAPC